MDWMLTDDELLDKLGLRPTGDEAYGQLSCGPDLSAQRRFRINPKVKLRRQKDFYGRYQDGKQHAV
jgi:hypothetical protein